MKKRANESVKENMKSNMKNNMNEMMERDSFVFYPSFLDSIELLPVEEQLKAYKLIAYYGIYGEVPEGEQSVANVILYMAMPSIDHAKKNRKNGAKGGRPSKKQKETDGFANEKPLGETYVDVHVHEDVAEDEDENGDVDVEVHGDGSVDESANAAKSVRQQYGAYGNVLLSDADMAALQQEFPADWQQRIERLSEYMAGTGKGYKNHLAIIRSWARKDSDKQAQKAQSAHKPEFGLVL